MAGGKCNSKEVMHPVLDGSDEELSENEENYVVDIQYEDMQCVMFNPQKTYDLQFTSKKIHFPTYINSILCAPTMA